MSIDEFVRANIEKDQVGFEKFSERRRFGLK